MKRVVVLGGGESGVGAAVLAQQKGFDVFLSDKGLLKEKHKEVLRNKNIPFEEGQHTETLIFNADEVVKSPGIPDAVPMIQRLKKQGVSVIGELELAARYTKGKLIGITGSNGKTTTTMLLFHVLSKAGLDVKMVGNVGESFALALSEQDHDYWVIEISSFQLDDMYETRLDISVLLNITPDHLDRYNNSMDEYASSKMQIIQNQTAADHFIFFKDDEWIAKKMKERELEMQLHPFSLTTPVKNGAYLENNEKLIFNYKEEFDMSIQKLALQGKHNASNSMAAGIASRILEIRKEAIRDSLSDFESIEHRLEKVATVSGVDYVNDSKATNVNSTWYALESMLQPTIWIVGGVDKGNDYTQLTELVTDKVKGIVALGLDNHKIISSFTGVVDQIAEANSMEEAVALAYRMGKKGDSVLLSPACASFDLFENYEDRGQQFKNCVRAL